MKKLFMKLIAVALVVSMVAVTNLQVFAAGNNSTEQLYVSEIKMATCDSLAEAKAELDGYTVVESNINEGMSNGAQQVYLGYKTTKDKNKAITDLRMMDMNGGYSFCDYDKALERQLAAAQEEVKSFFDAVREFQKNYKAGSKNAVYAYNQMNKYKDDDQNVLIGDLFIDESVSVEKLQTVFMQGNGSIVMAIEELLAIGCADNWLGRLGDNARKVYDSSAAVLDEYCEMIRAQWGTMYDGLVKYEEQLNDENGYDIKTFSVESYNEWSTGNGITDAKKSIVLSYGPAYIMLEDIKYKSGTLLDYFMVPLDEVDYTYLYPMADAMTKGQLQTMKFIGLQKSLCYARTDISLFSEEIKENEKRIQQIVVDAANEEIEDENQKLQVPAENTVVSVYVGVDRSLFEQDGGLALTNDAIRKSSTSNDASAISQVFASVKTDLIVTAAVGGLAVLLTAVEFIYKGVTLPTAGVLKEVVDIGNGAQLVYELAAEPGSPLYAAAKSSFVSSGILFGVSLGAMLIVTGLLIYSGYKKYMNPSYKVVPRAIIEEKTVDIYNSYNIKVGTKDYYLPYYAVEDAVADEEHGKYADMNAWKAQQWNVMYYTTDKRAGQPILADTFKVYVGNHQKPDGYAPFRLFGIDSTAADVNQHAFKEVPGVFIYYKTAEAETASGTASVFTGGYYAVTAVAGLVVGALAMFGAGVVLNKKRRKNNTPAEA